MSGASLQIAWAFVSPLILCYLHCSFAYTIRYSSPYGSFLQLFVCGYHNLWILLHLISHPRLQYRGGGKDWVDIQLSHDVRHSPTPTSGREAHAPPSSIDHVRVFRLQDNPSSLQLWLRSRDSPTTSPYSAPASAIFRERPRKPQGCHFSPPYNHPLP